LLKKFHLSGTDHQLFLQNNHPAARRFACIGVDTKASRRRRAVMIECQSRGRAATLAEHKSTTRLPTRSAAGRSLPRPACGQNETTDVDR